MRRARRWDVRLGLALLAFGPAWAPALAQVEEGPSALQTVERLVAAGRSDEARAALLEWWDAEWSGASRADAQRALWLRGRLTVDPSEAELDYRRLVVEYPGGPFTDDALLRLAQSAQATGDIEAARAHVATLARDYPGTPVAERAQRWLEGAGEPLLRVDARAISPPPEPERRGEIVESAGPHPQVPVAAEVTHGRFTVQLGAFANAARARSLLGRATELGVDTRIVRMPGTQLLHVRTGRFDSPEEARELLAAIELLGFSGAVVGDADSEEGIGS